MDNVIARDTQEIARHSSFQLRERQMNLYGICDKCQMAEAS